LEVASRIRLSKHSTTRQGKRMGFLDTLAEKLIDELSSARRERSHVQQELRDQFKTVLYEYSVQIERTRVACWNVRESLVKSGIAPGEELAVAGTALSRIREAMFSDAAPVRLDDESAARLGQADAREVVLRELIGEYTSLYHPADELHHETRALDQVWTLLRPLLDESLDAHLVDQLRGFRHDLRKDLELLRDVLRHVASGTLRHDRERTTQTVAQIDRSLTRLDQWASIMSELSKAIVGSRRAGLG